jgi:hypothetical protein
VRRRKSSGDSHHRTVVAPSDHVGEGEEGRSDENSGRECVDEEEGETVKMDTLTGRGKTTPWGRNHIRHEPDEEDDELMMYANLKVLPPPFSLDTHVHRSLTWPTDFTV